MKPPKGQTARKRALNAPTVVDVAQAAGVSPQTVSNALNQPSRVKASTLDKVKKAIAQVGYRPSYAAQALRGGNSRTIALVTLGEDEATHFDRPYFGRVLNGVITAGERRSYKTLIHQAGPNDLGGLLALFEQGRVDGAVIIAGVAHSRDLRALHESGHPIALVDRRSTKFACAHADYQAGMSEMVEHVAGLGAKRLLYLSGRVGKERGTTPLGRLRGFETAVERLGLKSRAQVASCAWTASGGRAATLENLAHPAKIDAILCASDDIALGALSAARSLGIAVPGSLHIVGFDASPVAEMCDPPLTTIAVPFESLAEEATVRLLDQIENKTTGLGREYRAATQLVVRQS